MLIFKEGNTPFPPDVLCSHFNRTFSKNNQIWDTIIRSLLKSSFLRRRLRSCFSRLWYEEKNKANVLSVILAKNSLWIQHSCVFVFFCIDHTQSFLFSPVCLSPARREFPHTLLISQKITFSKKDKNFVSFFSSNVRLQKWMLTKMKRSPNFVECYFFLIVINAERAAIRQHPIFAKKMERTRKEILLSLYNQFCKRSKATKFPLYRKEEKLKVSLWWEWRNNTTPLFVSLLAIMICII